MRTKETFPVVLILALTLAGPASAAAGPGPDIEALLAAMTLPEKVGQMTMLTLNAVSKGQLPFSPAEPHELDPERLQRAIVEHHVGALFNIGHHAFPREHWRQMIAEIQELARGTRLGIPVLYGIDAVHGMTYAQEATSFPQQIGLAATWDPELVERVARISAYETRAQGIPWVFAPTAEPGRSPVHSRFFETFGEDTFLAGELTAAFVRGLQGQDPAQPHRVGATLKHFLGYTIPVSGKDRTTVSVSRRALQELFLPPFVQGMAAGAQAVVLSLADIDGLPVHADPGLVQGLLKDELGFAGVAVSDWGSVENIYAHHRAAASRKEAIALATAAGVDLAMVPFDVEHAQELVTLVREGRVAEARIDDAVRRILAFKARLGLFATPIHPAEQYPAYASPAHRQVALEAAVASLTLLKNQGGVLPLAKSGRLLVAGPAADAMAPLNGGWSYTWQGAETDRYLPDGVTILDAIRAQVGGERARHLPWREDGAVDPEAVAAAADGVDAIILCLGEPAYAENFGNIDDLTLPAAQLELARMLAALGKPTVLVLAQGRPRIITAIEPAMAAVLQAYLPGNEGGRAVAEVLFGDAEPAGRLPFTYPRGPNGLATYDHRISEDYAFDCLYPFGAGLAHTTFAYRHLEVSPRQLGPDGTLTVAVEVLNTGRRPGFEVVQVYASDLVASVAPAVKRLKAFRKIRLAPGESRRLTLTLSPRDLALVDRELHWRAEAGEFVIRVGDLSQGIVLTEGRVFPR
ncbi:MAG: glycoside hydrolase family 3 N-terminal domain-containing protein [Thermodesulfobacteriota bacterium]